MKSVAQVLYRRLRATSAFSPLRLFAAGEQGVWYDPSDFSTMFQDSAGTTPVTAVEQPVGLVLDKSRGLVLGSELVTNGDFSNGTTGWESGSGNTTLSVVNGEAKSEVTTATSSALLYRPVAFATSNVLYKVEFDVYSPGYSGAIRCSLNDSLAADGFSFTATVTATKTRVTSYLRAGPTPKLYITSTPSALSLGSIVYFDNVSVKQVQGSHLSQSTSASRPVLSARVNLLTYTEQFDNAAWTNLTNATVSSTSETTAPNGTMTAYKFTDNATSGSHRVSQAASASFAVPYTLLIRMKKATQRYAFIHLRGYNGNNWYSIVVDLDTGLVTSSDTFGTPNGSNIITRDSISEWCSVSITSTNVSGGPPAVILGTAGSATPSFSNGFPTYAGTGTSIYIWGADLRVTNDGVNLPVYQRVNTSTDYDTTGFPYYLRFDGTDDSMATGTITPGIDKAQVFAGVRKLSDAADGRVVQHGDPSSSDNGSLSIDAPGSSAVTRYQFASRGTVTAVPFTTSAAFNAPNTSVVTGIGDISGDAARLRLNGSQVSQITTDQGAGNFLAYPLYIGRRGGTTVPFNGHLYGLIARFGANLPDATIAQTETWVAGKTGLSVTPTFPAPNNLIWATGNTLIWDTGNNITWGNS